MPHVHFTANLTRHVAAPSVVVSGLTVGEALDAVFRGHPVLRGYILDEQGALRTHVIVFIDGETIRDRVKLRDPVRPESELYVMQALSGG